MKASPWGEENCKQFGALATDEGGYISATIGMYLSPEAERHMGRSAKSATNLNFFYPVA